MGLEPCRWRPRRSWGVFEGAGKEPPRNALAGPDRSTPRAPHSGVRGVQAWPVASRAPTLRATTALALASAATYGQVPGSQSSSPTQRRGEARTMSPGGRDSVATRWGPTSARSSAIPCATPVQSGRPGRRSSSSVGRQALGFHPSVAPNRSRETPSCGTRSSVPVQRRAMGLHRDGRYAREDGEFWGSESQGNRVRLRPMLFRIGSGYHSTAQAVEVVLTPYRPRRRAAPRAPPTRGRSHGTLITTEREARRRDRGSASNSTISPQCTRLDSMPDWTVLEEMLIRVARHCIAAVGGLRSDRHRRVTIGQC
jgi:hypothetical protein